MNNLKLSWIGVDCAQNGPSGGGQCVCTRSLSNVSRDRCKIKWPKQEIHIGTHCEINWSKLVSPFQVWLTVWATPVQKTRELVLCWLNVLSCEGVFVHRVLGSPVLLRGNSSHSEALRIHLYFLSSSIWAWLRVLICRQFRLTYRYIIGLKFNKMFNPRGMFFDLLAHRSGWKSFSC